MVHVLFRAGYKVWIIEIEYAPKYTVVNGTIDLKCLNIECAFHLTQSGKFVSFFIVINANGSCNRLCNCLVAFCILWTYRIIIINPGVFPGFVCLIYELVSAFNFKLVNGLSRGLYLSTFSVVYWMLFPVHFAIYSYHMGLKISKMTEVCSLILHVFCFKFDKEIYIVFWLMTFKFLIFYIPHFYFYF